MINVVVSEDKGGAFDAYSRDLRLHVSAIAPRWDQFDKMDTCIFPIAWRHI